MSVTIIHATRPLTDLRIAGDGQVQTVFNAICDSCDVHDIALEIESWTSLTDQKEGPVPIFWTAEM